MLEELGLAPIDGIDNAAADDDEAAEGAAFAGGGHESDADSLQDAMGW